MTGVKNNLCDVKYLNPEQGDFFFGYYDIPSYSADGRNHLANKLPFTHRLNTKKDKLELGFLKDGIFTFFESNDCWCFQQGSFLQFKYGSSDDVFYNIYDKADGEYKTVKRKLSDGKVETFDGASATVSRDGRYGLSVNFNRIWDFRPGYGYCNTKDPYFDFPLPSEDGIFLCDFLAGTKKLIIDYKRMLKEFPIEGKENAKFVVNHITFNPSGNRFLFLLRDFPQAGSSKWWSTSLITADLKGNMRMVCKDTMVSHYWWADDKTIIAYCQPNGADKWGVYSINESDGSFVNICGDFSDISRDIHCSLSPNGKYLIGDGYPDAEGYRHIWIKNLQSGRSSILLSSKTIVPDVEDIRCDLHARFNPDGSKISFDSFHRGKRDICEIDMIGFNL